jgi:Fe-S-cluster containining protein
MKKNTNEKRCDGREKSLYFYHDQNWSCISCGRCCGIWDIPITPQEKARIERLKIPGFDFKTQNYFIPVKGHRLFVIKKDGKSCVFLDKDNYCVIHKHHGEAVKALACRMYPYNISLWEDEINSVSFRFDCTAVSTNQGKTLTKHKNTINTLINELLKKGSKKNSAVYRDNLKPELSNLRVIAHSYKELIFADSSSLNTKIYFASCLVTFHENPKNKQDILNPVEFETASLTYLKEQDELINATVKSADKADKITLLRFYYILTGYIRVDEHTRLKGFFAGRLGRAKAILKFITGKGNMHQFGDEYPDTSGIKMIDAIEKISFHKETESIIKRYFASQLESLHFCGKHGLNLTFEEGMRHLLLAYPAIMSITALIATAEKRTETQLNDIYKALRIVDHTFYHSPFFKLKHIKKMVNCLTSEKVFPSILNTFGLK